MLLPFAEEWEKEFPETDEEFEDYQGRKAFAEFEPAVRAAGLTPKWCSPYHFQILGGQRLVNYYRPTGRRYYPLACFDRGKGQRVTLREAITHAGQPKSLPPAGSCHSPDDKPTFSEYRRHRVNLPDNVAPFDEDVRPTPLPIAAYDWI